MLSAVRAKSIECVRLLLEQESINVYCQNYVNTSALHAAVTIGLPDITALLLEYGARADILEDMNITPIFTASQHGQTACLKLLLDSLTTSGISLAAVFRLRFKQLFGCCYDFPFPLFLTCVSAIFADIFPVKLFIGGSLLYWYSLSVIQINRSVIFNRGSAEPLGSAGIC